ncbi:hypothetical protein RB608_01615 [Nocardioides sp. LHD-245]|uniref:hypothetical protein n=1 Tax=Nocardioides sp. LHD-245 TaxID=3051387 RepID=UPI0027DF79CE|nr:hypothetical protein [Nocardioides sp. LHD-245]
MRRLVSAGVVAITAVALATPALTSAATAAPGTDGPVVAAKVKAGNKIKVKKSADGVQPGISKLVLTATKLRGSGKAKFTIAGDNGVTLKGKAKAKKGKAKYTVPALGTGHYKVKVKFKKQKGKTKFEVYDSALTVSTTTLTCDISTPASSTPLSGSVKYKGGPATTGYVDFYQNGNVAGGSQSPSFLGFESFYPAGSGQFNAGTDFCREITSGTGLAGGNLAPFGPGTYTFQAYYTKDAGYDDYISSNFLTVTVVP